MLQIPHLRKPALIFAATALFLLLAGGRSLAGDSSVEPAPVRVWQDTITIPSYEEGLPDPNPPFDYFVQDYRHNYPYTCLLYTSRCV